MTIESDLSRNQNQKISNNYREDYLKYGTTHLKHGTISHEKLKLHPKGTVSFEIISDGRMCI